MKVPSSLEFPLFHHFAAGLMTPKRADQNGHHKQINKQQVLVRLWRNGNPNIPLVGMHAGAAPMENSMEFPQKTKNRTAF